MKNSSPPDKKKGGFISSTENYKHVAEPSGPSPIDPSKLSMDSKRGDLKPIWLEAFRKMRTIYGACLSTNLDRKTVYDWISKDREFKNQLKMLQRETREVLIQTGYARALNREDPGSIPLLIFLLKSMAGLSESSKIHVDIRVAYEVVNQIIQVINKIPGSCPHCHSTLDIKKEIAENLTSLSKKFDRQEMVFLNESEDHNS